MRYRKSKHGAFWGCAKYPKCKGLRNADGEDKSPSDNKKTKGKKSQSSKTTISKDITCPECEKPMRLVPERPGKYKAFWSCTDYPQCKGTRQHEDAADKKANKTSSTKSTKKSTTSSGASNSTSNRAIGSSPSCPECGSEMFRVPAQNGQPEHYSCRYAPDCDGKIITDK